MKLLIHPKNNLGLGYHRVRPRVKNTLRTVCPARGKFSQNFSIVHLGVMKTLTIFVDLENRVFCIYLKEFIAIFIDVTLYFALGEAHIEYPRMVI